MTLEPTGTNTAVLYLIIHPPHNCVTKHGLPDTQKLEYCKFLSLLAWLGGTRLAQLNIPP